VPSDLQFRVVTLERDAREAPAAAHTNTDDIRLEAVALGKAAVAANLPLRLMGGLAVWVTSPSVRPAGVARPYGDIDVIGESRANAAIKSFLVGRGYVPERMFNAIHGAQRLNFAHPSGRWTIDVLLDELRMSHTIDLRGRLRTPGPTIDLADLLLTKLQIWEINRKDLADAAAVLADHALERRAGVPSTDAVDLDRIASLAGSDWGLCHTLERNLERVATLGEEGLFRAAPLDVVNQVRDLIVAIGASPKSLGWRARARVGERKRWYETPEEVRH
jgi:hypothetical protein